MALTRIIMIILLLSLLACPALAQIANVDSQGKSDIDRAIDMVFNFEVGWIALAGVVTFIGLFRLAHNSLRRPRNIRLARGAAARYGSLGSMRGTARGAAKGYQQGRSQLQQGTRDIKTSLLWNSTGRRRL